jgi:hypothetical protein
MINWLVPSDEFDEQKPRAPTKEVPPERANNKNPNTDYCELCMLQIEQAQLCLQSGLPLLTFVLHGQPDGRP